jgi:glyoxylase-like metal-dependent hydrolase (beta-lactamase superfamily II)
MGGHNAPRSAGELGGGVAAFQVDLGERSKRACFTMARILAEELSHFVIEDGARRIVVDTGVGISKDHPQVPEFDTSIDRFSPTLLQRASPPDAVVCTHLHVDHVGWNTLPDQPRHALLPEPTGRAARIPTRHPTEAAGHEVVSPP